VATTASKNAGLTIDEHDIVGRDGPVRVRDYHPASRTTRTAFLWVHGGGFAYGGLDMKESDAPARELAASGTFVRTVHYRLAPRIGLFSQPDLAQLPGRFPAGLHDVIDTALSLAELEGAPINLGGASAGANLAAAAALSLREEGPTTLRSLALAYGAFHAVLPFGSNIERELRGPIARWAFNPSMYRRIALNYVGDTALLVPGPAFPGGSELSGLPPTFLFNASNDRLRASGHAFADELRSAGIDVQETVVTGTHGFLGATGRRKYADGMRELTGWLAAHD
jgi:acetyl esterase